MTQESRDNSNKLKDRAFVMNLNKYDDIGTHWVVIYVKNDEVTYFVSFVVECIPEVIKRFLGNKDFIVNIYRIQVCDSMMSGYFCIGFAN